MKTKRKRKGKENGSETTVKAGEEEKKKGLR